MAGASQNSRNGSRFSRMGLYAVVASPCEVTLNWFTPFVLLLRLLVAPRELPSFLDACAALQASTSAMDTSGGAGDESTSLRVCEPASLRLCVSPVCMLGSLSLGTPGTCVEIDCGGTPYSVKDNNQRRLFLLTPLR